MALYWTGNGYNNHHMTWARKQTNIYLFIHYMQPHHLNQGPLIVSKIYYTLDHLSLSYYKVLHKSSKNAKQFVHFKWFPNIYFVTI